MIKIFNQGYIDSRYQLINIGTDYFPSWNYYYPEGKKSGLIVFHTNHGFRVKENPTDLSEYEINLIIHEFEKRKTQLLNI